jgi:P27 family predicted phage terminase small subunit
MLRKRRTLTRGDGPALEMLSEAYARWRACLKDIEENGIMIQEDRISKSGEPYTVRVQNPAAKLATSLENSMRAMLKEFAATPASRERVRPAKEKEKEDGGLFV